MLIQEDIAHAHILLVVHKIMVSSLILVIFLINLRNGFISL